MAEAEATLVAWLAAAFPSAFVCTETPANLADVLPVIRVRRIAGAAEYIYTFDNPVLDFDCYDATHEAARSLAYAVRSSIHQDLPGQVVGATGHKGMVSRVRELSGPTMTPYDDTNVRRFTNSVQLRLHSI